MVLLPELEILNFYIGSDLDRRFCVFDYEGSA